MVHFIGKTTSCFHCIIFPILLKEHGGFNLPINVRPNEFVKLRRWKLSYIQEIGQFGVHEYLEDFSHGQEDVLRLVL